MHITIQTEILSEYFHHVLLLDNVLMDKVMLSSLGEMMIIILTVVLAVGRTSCWKLLYIFMTIRHFTHSFLYSILSTNQHYPPQCS